jgi:hypothetical protein
VQALKSAIHVAGRAQVYQSSIAVGNINLFGNAIIKLLGRLSMNGIGRHFRRFSNIRVGKVDDFLLCSLQLSNLFGTAGSIDKIIDYFFWNLLF